MTLAALSAARYAASSLGLAAVAVSALIVGYLVVGPVPVEPDPYDGRTGCHQPSRTSPGDDAGSCPVDSAVHRVTLGEISVIGTYEYEAACARIAAYQDAFERCLAVASDAAVGGLRDGGRVTIYARVVAGEVAEAAAVGTDLAVARCMANVVTQIGFASSIDTSLMIPVEITAGYFKPLRQSNR